MRNRQVDEKNLGKNSARQIGAGRSRKITTAVETDY